MDRSRWTKLALAAPAIFLLVFMVPCSSPGEAPTKTTNKPPDYRELRLFRNVMGIVQKNYVKEVTDKELVQGAIHGMLQSLDPNSSFLTDEMVKGLEEEQKRESAEVGLDLSVENGILTVVSPIEDTPAFKAGLKPGDKIVKINGETTKSINLLKATELMRGPKDSKVTIAVMREGWRRAKDFTLARELIHVKSVRKEQISPGYAYVRVVGFQDKTDTDIASAIKEMGGNERIKGLVLDLRNNAGDVRNNPGAAPDMAVKVAQLFIDKGLVVSADGKSKEQKTDFKASSAGTHYKFRLAVLINEGSASASEIVAGALQDHDRCLVFGSKSFGKASVQTRIPLEDGSDLRLTTALYYTPNGHKIQTTGIQPDVDLKEDLNKNSDQASQQGENKSTVSKNKSGKAAASRALAVDLEKDPVLKKAVDWLKSDVEVKRYKEEHPRKVVAETEAPKPEIE